MERFVAHIGALNGSLQERPEVLAAVGVDVAVNVGFSVVNDVVDVFTVEPVVRQEHVGVDGRTSFDVSADVPLNMSALQTAEYFGANLTDAVLSVSVEQSHHSDLTGDASAAL